MLTLLILLLLVYSNLCEPPGILYIIITQKGQFHQALAMKTEDHILGQYNPQDSLPEIFWSDADLHQPTADTAFSVFTLRKFCNKLGCSKKTKILLFRSNIEFPKEKFFKN